MTSDGELRQRIIDAAAEATDAKECRPPLAAIIAAAGEVFAALSAAGSWRR